MNTQRLRDFRYTWSTPVSRDNWKRYLVHDRDNPSRQGASVIFSKFLEKASLPQSFAEIGFGPCDDFDLFLRQLHDENKILYTGYDVTEQFVSYAQAEYPGYDFRPGGFRDLQGTFDITYTRHTLMHLNPGLCDPCLRAMLQATKHLAVVSWRLTPSSGTIRWNPDTGTRGAWVNRYDRDKVLSLIDECGFYCEMHEFGNRLSDTIYELRRTGHAH